MAVSIIIPTFNRSKSLLKCLNALSKQSIDRSWEVIVVDDGGKTGLNEIIQSFAQSLEIKLIKQENKGPAAARNLGVKQAKGEYIAFLDDDCEPMPYWISALYKNARYGCMVGGRTENKLKENVYSEASQLIVSYLYEYFKDTPWYFFTSNNFLLDKATFLSSGGFDETFKTSAGEDREFCVRWSHLGNRMEYNPAAVIYHAHEMNLWSFWKQHFKYGKAAVDFCRKIKDLGIPDLKPSTRFYISLFSFAWNVEEFNYSKKFGLVFFLFVSQAATFFGFLSTKRTFKILR